MLAAEIASTTAKPSMIVARNRKVGSLKDEPLRFRNRTSTPRFRSENQALEAPAPNPVRKLKAEWIRPRKCGQNRQGGGIRALPCAPSPACGGGLGWGCLRTEILCVERAPTRRALRARRPKSELRSSRPPQAGEAKLPSR